MPRPPTRRLPRRATSCASRSGSSLPTTSSPISSRHSSAQPPAQARSRAARVRRLTLVAGAVLLVAVSGASAREGAPTFGDAGRRATATLLGTWYAGSGLWRRCNAPDCEVGNADWGDDSLTYALALRYSATHDTRLLVPLRALVRTARRYP